jgi:hypothetical protein
MPRVEDIRVQIRELMRTVPFQRFVLNMENGDRVLVEHPENIAFDPVPNSRRSALSVITGEVQLYNSLDAVSSVVIKDRNVAAA